jgi:two-component system, response regulator YesN
MNEPKASNSDTPGRGMGEIYLVDDEPMLLELASVILKPLGCAIRTFRNPEAAIKEYTSAETRPVLLITDYAMPIMNGLELIEACRRVQPSQKTLLLSGTVGPDICAGVVPRLDGYLAKPYQAKQLVETVRALLAAQPQET